MYSHAHDEDTDRGRRSQRVRRGRAAPPAARAIPAIEIGALTGASNAGQPLGVLQPHLVPLADRVLVETSIDTLAGHDVVFLALPHGQSGAIAAELGERDPARSS